VTSLQAAGSLPHEGPIHMIELEQLSEALVRLGCPPHKSMEMAQQLDKRAHQLSTQKNQSYEQALEYLLSLFQQGWAAPKSNSPPSP
jgi:hypothetical protein